VSWNLYFPRYTILQFSFAVVIPLDMPVKTRRGNMNFGIQCNYDLPWNSTYFYKPMYYEMNKRSFDHEIHDNVTTKGNNENVVSRVKKDLTAGELYSSIENLFELFGYHSECFQKSICELASTPLNPNYNFTSGIFHDDEDIFHQVIHFILSPSVHQSFDSNTENTIKDIYETAEKIGRENGDCHTVYSNCLSSPLDLITHSIEEYED
jgi:hypothetical protein